MRPIDADELLNEIDRHAFDFGLDDLHMLEDVINSMSTVDSKKNKDWKIAYDNLLNDYIKLKRDNEQKHGHWIKVNNENLNNAWVCSECGHMVYSPKEELMNKFKGCYCGAKMDEVTE